MSRKAEMKGCLHKGCIISWDTRRERRLLPSAFFESLLWTLFGSDVCETPNEMDGILASGLCCGTYWVSFRWSAIWILLSVEKMLKHSFIVFFLLSIWMQLFDLLKYSSRMLGSKQSKTFPWLVLVVNCPPCSNRKRKICSYPLSMAT